VDKLHYDYLLIGGGRTSANAAQSIREIDAHGSIAIVAKENRKPYDRPPLSKNFLQGKPADPEDVESKPDDFFEKFKVALMKGVEAVSIDREQKTVSLSDGRVIGYGKLLLATGSTPNHLRITGSDLKNIFYLRTVDDSVRIRDAAQEEKSFAFIGSGYIGMEVASWLHGVGVRATVIGQEEHPWAKFLSPKSGEFLQKYFSDRGVQFRMNSKVASFIGDGSVRAVQLDDGSEIPCDAVVAGIGVRLNTELAKAAGLDLDEKGAIKTDSTLRTADPNIWAAGDIAAFLDKTAEKRWHAEHYMNATWQGEQVGKNMAGEVSDYDKVAYFFSDMFDLAFVLRGDPQGGKSAKFLGDVDAGEFIELYADNGGTLVMGLAFTHDTKKQDLISDKLEEAILARRAVSDLDENYFLAS
jgi:3-phenylpropionate/trans-cinnamate dioxygenase ferredoxin reductase subunit